MSELTGAVSLVCRGQWVAAVVTYWSVDHGTSGAAPGSTRGPVRINQTSDGEQPGPGQLRHTQWYLDNYSSSRVRTHTHTHTLDVKAVNVSFHNVWRKFLLHNMVHNANVTNTNITKWTVWLEEILKAY